MRHLAPALLLLTASAQNAPENRIDWRWDRNTPSCSLQQAYSSDGGIVQIARTPANDQTSIFIGGVKPILAPSKTYPGGKIIFSTNEQLDADIYVTSESGRRDVFASSENPEFLSKLAKASTIEFSQEKLGSVRVPLRSASAAVESLRTCENSKMREWGIDPVAWRALKVKPLPAKPPTEWLSTDDYPASAILDGIQGFVIARFAVGADGSVLECRAITRSRSVNYKDRLCPKLKRRARFKPALDINGNPVAALYVLVIQFRLA